MTTRALEYGEVVEFNSRHRIMLNVKLKDASTSDLILELQAMRNRHNLGYTA